MIPLFKNNKLLGQIDTVNKLYYSERRMEHFFNKYNGFGISFKVLDILQENNIDTILIRFENREDFITSINSFLVHGIEYQDKEDKQLILPIQFFNNKIAIENQGVLA